MSESSEQERVGKLLRLLEDTLEGELYLSRNEKMVKIGQIHTERRGFGKAKGRPDIIIWINIHTWILGALTDGKFPILIEDEVSGMDSVKEDYEAFFRDDETLVPMIVVGGDKIDESTRTVTGRLRIGIKQRPTHLVLSKT
jgi:hypothetical protein